MNSRAVSNLEMVQPLTLCWWIFAVRGGLAVVFAVVLFLTSSFLGIFFFDPVTLVYLSLCRFFRVEQRTSLRSGSRVRL